MENDEGLHFLLPIVDDTAILRATGEESVDYPSALFDNFLRRTNNIAKPSTSQASRTNGMALSGGGAGAISKKTKTAPIMIVPSTGEMR